MQCSMRPQLVQSPFQHRNLEVLMLPFNARKIAPATSPTTDDASLPTTSLLASHAGKSGIKRASTACQNCKNIKRKCNQQQPCSNCIKTGTDCIFDQAQDGRRRAARKRNVEELELKRDALDTILDAFRQSDDGSVQTLLSMIKSNAPLDDIIQYALLHTQNDTNAQLAALNVTADNGFSRRSVLSISALCDTPTIRVPAAPWTSVTDDDDVVSHLVSTYFTWHHPAYPCVAQDLFVADMRSRDLSSNFCSPLLVNAILALACHFSDHHGVFQNPNDPTTRGQHFLDRATELWRESGHQPKVTTIQAAQLIAMAFTFAGKDRFSNLYMNQIKDLAEEVTFRVQNIPSKSPALEGIRRSLKLALWSRYLLNVGYSLAFMRAPDDVRPPTDRPPLDDSTFHGTTVWQPYPNQEPSVQTNFARFAELQYDLHEVGEGIANFVFGPNDEHVNVLNTLHDLDQKLSSLSQHIPWSDEGTILNPHLMDLNLAFHWMRMTLFNFVRIPNSAADGPYGPGDRLHRYAREQCIASANIIASLFKRYFYDYGSRNLTIWMPQTAISTAYMMIEDLDNPNAQEIFHQVCIVLTSMSRRWLIMKGHARMLFITAEQSGKTIPEQTRQILSRVAVDNWRSTDHKYFDSSAYPNYALAKDQDPRATTMGDLLEFWANSGVYLENNHSNNYSIGPKTPNTESEGVPSAGSTMELSEEGVP